MRLTVHSQRTALVATVLGFLLLSGCAGQSSLGMSSSPPASTPSSAGASATAYPTSTVGTVGGSAPWYAWTDDIYGFQLDIPGYVTPDSYNSFGIGGEEWVWSLPTNTSPGPDQIITITVDAATRVHTSDCVKGRSLTVGSGIPGVENDNFIPAATPPPGAFGGVPTMLAGFSSIGVYIVVRLATPIVYGLSAWQKAYGATWQHILASYEPGAKSFGATSPCASPSP